MWEYRTKAQKTSQRGGVGVKPIKRRSKRRGLWAGVTPAASDLTALAGVSRLKRDAGGHLRGVVSALLLQCDVSACVCTDVCTRGFGMQRDRSFILK